MKPEEVQHVAAQSGFHRITPRVRQTRHSALRLKAVASRVHSAFTLSMPRSSNRWAPIRVLRMANSGSTRGSLRR